MIRRTFLLITALLLAAAFTTDLVAQATADYRTSAEYIKPKAREVWFYGLRSYPFGQIPKDARLNALDYAQTQMGGDLKGSYTLAQKEWRQIGPFNVGGRVRAVATHPSDPLTVWVGAADGGVWKTTNGGESWTPYMQDQNAIAMGALAVDPNNPDVLYAGTGEMSSNVNSYNGAGIFKSEDGGETWRLLGLTNVGAFAKIIVHPSNSGIIYAGGTKNNAGFHKSIDGGATWRRTDNRAVSDVAINRQNPDELWVTGTTGGVLYSNDGGESFTRRNVGLGGTGITLDRSTIAIDPTDPNRLFLASYETAGTSGTQHYSRIYRTTNKGQSWSKMFEGSTASPGSNFFANGVQSQGWYNNVISISPTNPQVIIAGGVRLVRSTNGGATGSWQAVGNNSVHPDQHAMAWASNGTLFLGNDGGVYSSADEGGSFQAKNNGLAITQFYAMKIDQTEDELTYGGTQDNGTLRNLSETYGDILGGDGFYVAIDHNNPNIIYVENQNGQIYRLYVDGTGGGRISDFLSQNEDAPWSAPLLLDPKDGLRLYAGRRSLWVTLNPQSPTPTWIKLSPRMGNTAFVSAIGVSSVDNNFILVGSNEGTIFRSTNAGEEWTDLTFSSGLPNRAIMDFAMSRTNAGTAYIAYSGFYTSHIFKTTDFGETWTDVGIGLPDIPFNALALHPEDENIIYAGSDIGMFASFDGGQSWHPFSNGLPRVSVVDLDVHLESKTLRLATHGRSMWEIDISEEPEVVPAITAPHGGEIWMGRTQHAINWSGFTEPGGVRLDYSLDDGRTWRTLGQGLAGNGYLWNVVDANTFTARVRVTAMNNPAITATSNTFTILPYSQGAILVTDSKPTIPYGIAYDGELLWATDFGSNRLLKIDPATLNAVGEVTIKADLPDDGVNAGLGDSLFTDITYYPPRGTFFVHCLKNTTATNPGGFLLEIDKEGNRVGYWESPSAYPIGLAWLGSKNPEIPFLLASDRNLTQKLYYYDPESLPTTGGVLDALIEYPRDQRKNLGPRGLAADTGRFWQIITDFEGEVLRDADAMDLVIGEPGNQTPECVIPLVSPTTSTINGRGIEVDPSDNSLWISDYGGNIYKITTCKTTPPPTDTGTTLATSVNGPHVPDGVSLEQNVPNPFSSRTDITFSIPNAMRATIVVHDMTGEEVMRIDERLYTAGRHIIPFVPLGLHAGVYRYTLLLDGGGSISRTMVYVK